MRAKRTAAEEDTPAAEPAAESGRKRGRRSERAAKQTTDDVAAAPSSSKDSSKDHVNELMPFLEFVERHPVGTSCTAQVESYASHGAYARTGDVLIYIPLRLMDDPTPRSARSVLKVGEAVALVVVGFTPERRSIDAAMPHMAAELGRRRDGVGARAAGSRQEEPGEEGGRQEGAGEEGDCQEGAGEEGDCQEERRRRRAPAKKAPAKKAVTEKSAARKSPAKKAAATRSATKKSPAKKAAATRSAAKKTPAKTTAAKRAPAKRSPAKRADT